MNVEQTINFFSVLGLKEIRRFENSSGRFTLIYLKDSSSSMEIELTYNWDQTENYFIGNNFGHIAFSVSNIYDTCYEFKNIGAIISVPPRDGVMAFIKTPDGISIELLQKGHLIAADSYWKNEPNIGTW